MWRHASAASLMVESAREGVEEEWEGVGNNRGACCACAAACLAWRLRARKHEVHGHMDLSNELVMAKERE